MGGWCILYLLPRLDGDAGHGPLPHALLDKLAPAPLALALEAQHGRDFFPLGHDEGVLAVAAGLDVGEGLDCLVLAADLGEPARRAWQEWQAEHEEDAGHKLHAPGRSERGGAVDERTAVADEVHEEDSPLDGELLDDDDTAAAFHLGNFSEVDGDLGRSDSDADAVEEAAGDERSEAIGSHLDGSTGKPPETGKEDAVATTKPVGDRTSHQATDDRPGRKRRADGTLDDAMGVVKVVNVLIRAHNGRHGRNVKPEKHASYRRHHGDEVGIC